ncbi:MAG: transglycosylase SLT domain-containing protein [Epsilonproteobacteria bacterium]|nr:transglycosylase SLT domain-containing protein [Campylobacterota bacterium]
MKKLLISLIVFYQTCFGFFGMDENFEKEIEILQTLDIDPSFARNDLFLSMKEDVQKSQINALLKVLKKGYPFITTLQNMISESKIPKSFLYLAMVESNFSPEAKSRAKAAGLWQLMPKTAKKLGLKINRYVDERFDPVKSTKAAIDYLTFLHKRFKKWYLVAIAYNCGEGALAKAIKKAKTDDLNVLLDPDKKYIPKESRNYIKKILLMSHIANNIDLIIKKEATFLLNRDKNSFLQSIEVDRGVDLRKLAKEYGISYSELRYYNAHIKRGYIPKNIKNCNVYIPSASLDYIAKYAKKSFKKRPRRIKYKVKKGDTLIKIAKKFKTKVRLIKLANNLKTPIIRTGKSIVIPR